MEQVRHRRCGIMITVASSSSVLVANGGVCVNNVSDVNFAVQSFARTICK